MIDEFDKDQDGYSTFLGLWVNLLVNEEEFLAIMKQTSIY
jgi:hypothetical protein